MKLRTMKVSVLILILVIGYDGYSHDIKMAVFEISRGESDKGLAISISVDKEDFLKTLFISSGMRLSTKENLKKEAQLYLESNLTIRVNGLCTSLIVTSVDYDNDNIQLEGVFEVSAHIISEVQVENYCLLDVVDDQENIVHLNLNDRQRSFRSNKNRVRTVATYYH